ncbi:nucleoside phosphorylase [Ahrensia sp. 13_GOM-1096m]|uniref:nucleoside phosphorylase n=1 Tax=Ahrensia sp. 13_GOM-1096m TaxID=1380380 RepID=UPI00047BFEB9|nr:nucleoside phosphorylase [Ahrensia sp. 13_GOM-1096m]
MTSKLHPTALMPFSNGKPPHLPCGPGDLAEDVLIPGDPDRVELLASMLDNVISFGRKREFAVITGTYKGHPLSICSSGIGGPSTEIALVELSMLGAKRVIRIGGMSALVPQIQTGSFLVVQNAIGMTGVGDLYGEKGSQSFSDTELSKALIQSANKHGMTSFAGTVATTDSYYLGQDRPVSLKENFSNAASKYLDRFREQGALGVDMESHVILSVSKRLGLKAACLLGVHGNRATNDWLVDYESTQRNLLCIAGSALTFTLKSET